MYSQSNLKYGTPIGSRGDIKIDDVAPLNSIEFYLREVRGIFLSTSSSYTKLNSCRSYTFQVVLLLLQLLQRFNFSGDGVVLSHICSDFDGRKVCMVNCKSKRENVLSKYQNSIYAIPVAKYNHFYELSIVRENQNK